MSDILQCVGEPHLLQHILTYLDCTAIGVVPTSKALQAELQAAKVHTHCQWYDRWQEPVAVTYAPSRLASGSSCCRCQHLIDKYSSLAQLLPPIQYYLHQTSGILWSHGDTSRRTPGCGELFCVLTESLYDLAKNVACLDIDEEWREQRQRPIPSDLDYVSFMENLRTITYAVDLVLPTSRTQNILYIANAIETVEIVLMDLLVGTMLPRYWHMRGRPYGMAIDQDDWLPSARHTYTNIHDILV